MNAFKMASVLTVCQSGEISPNLVTLLRSNEIWNLTWSESLKENNSPESASVWPQIGI